MTVTRRDFVKIGLMLAFSSIAKKKNVFAISHKLEQKVKINLPAYSLTLMNYINGNLKETLVFPVGIGKGCYGRKQTPISKGFIYEKRKKVIFRYEKDYPHLNIDKGDVIKWTNTFDKNGKPKGYCMPYSKMRGLGMKIKPDCYNLYYNDFVIHSTTDEFTIGTPASNGCIRVRIEDMLRLYDLISPQIEEGILQKQIPIEISYDLIKLNKKSIKLHANVYNKDINLVKEFKKEIKKTEFNQGDFDYDKIEQLFRLANKEFNSVHKQILNVLSKTYPKNFVPVYLREQLHRNYEISDFLKG